MKHFLRILLGLACSIALLAVLFRMVGGEIGPARDRMWEIAQSLDPKWLLLALAGMLFQAVIRAWRYAVLLRAGGEKALPSRGALLLVTFTRNMFVDFFPGRLGELSYVALLNRKFGLPAAPCLSSLSLSVLFDLAALLLLVAGLAGLHAAAGRALGWMGGVCLVLALVIAVGAVALFFGPGWVNSLLRRLPPWRGVRPLAGFMARLAGAFLQTRQEGVLGRVLGLSLLVRLGKYGGLYALFRCITQSNFPRFAAASPPQVIGTLLGAEGAASVPVPSFMSFGSYEAGGVAAWTALGFPAAEAALCMLAIHVVSQAIDYGLGGAALLALLGRRRDGGPLLTRRGWMIAACCALAIAASGFAGLRWRQNQKRGAPAAPAAGVAVNPPAPAPSALPRGFLIWSSNRSGNHDIWRMSLPDLRAEQVTTHPHTEYYPRLSPDGRRIAFARSRRPWVSYRNVLDWDVVTRDLASGAERVVATNATTPSWSGPDTLVFQANSGQVVEYHVRTGVSRLLCEEGRNGVPAGAVLIWPSFRSGESEVAVTMLGRARMTALLGTNGALRRVAGGCQLGWTPDGQSLLMTDHGGRMKNAFYRVDPVTLKREVLFDAPEPWSHEYFPRLSPDGRWLAYAACAKGHEHDTADYEVFLWEVGKPVESAARLTWHTGNDTWPDLWLESRP